MATGSLAHSPLHRVLVRVSESCFGIERKLQKYFQNPWRSGGGKCRVKAGPHEDTFWVEFYKRQSKESVIAKKDHSLVMGDEIHVNIYLETNEELGENILEVNQPSSETQSVPEEGVDLASANTFTHKIFLDVEVDLSLKLSEEQREKIANLCPNLKIEKGHDGNETVIGDYQDIEKMYEILSDGMLENIKKVVSPHSPSTREIRHIMPIDSDSSVPPSNPNCKTEEESDIIAVPSHLYEYFKYFFAETLDRIESEHKVHIRSIVSCPMGDVCLDFEPSKKGDRKAAQDDFTRAFQKETQNVTRQEVHFTDSKLVIIVKKRLTDVFKSIRIKAETKVLILWGNPQDILGAQRFVEANFSRKYPLEIMLSQNTMKNEIEVDPVYLRLLYQEIREIEKKYDTVMEVVNKPRARTTFIVFKPKHKDLDLSELAYEDSTEVFQVLLPQIVREVVSLKSLHKEKKRGPEKPFFDDFEINYPHVNLEWQEQQLTLTGLPKYLEEAVKYVKRYFNIDGHAQQRQKSATSLKKNSNKKPKSSDKTGASPVSKGSPSSVDVKKEEVEEVEEEEEECIICLEIIHHKEVLSKCKHKFCGPCIREAMKRKPVCPVCQTSYEVIKGNQPDGTMTTFYKTSSLPGYNSCGTIVIQYDMQGGIQTDDHPNPGKRYEGTKQVAYLPNNEEGQQVLNLLRRAFDQRLIFTILRSGTPGVSDVITWNDIHHKTLQYGGAENLGYPDPSYLQRVKLQLKAKGIE